MNLLILLMSLLILCKNEEEASELGRKIVLVMTLAYMIEDEFVSHSDAIKYVDAPIFLEAMN